MVPQSIDAVVKLSRATGNMTMYNGWPGGLSLGTYAFIGGAFDGSSVWLVPVNANAVVKVSTATGAMTMHNAWPAGL